MGSPSVLSALVSSGAGASIAAIVVAAIQSRTSKGVSRAQAADLVTQVQDRTIKRLERENKEMRKAILLLTDCLDDIIAETHMSLEVKEKLKKARRVAQEAI